MDRVTTTISLDRSDWQALKVLAAREGKSLAALFREAAESILESVAIRSKRKSFKNDPIWKLGTGKYCFRGGDPDLSQKIDEILYGGK